MNATASHAHSLCFTGATTMRGPLGTRVDPGTFRTVSFSDVKRWGKGRTWGNRAGWIVAELFDGSELWGHLADQKDDRARAALKPVAKLPTPDPDLAAAHARVRWAS